MKKRRKKTSGQIEEKHTQHVFKTEKGCPLHIMYLDGGLVPARFLIMCNMLNFLQKDDKSLLLNIPEAQMNSSLKTIWNSEVKSILNYLEIKMRHKEIKVTPKSVFKKIVRGKNESMAIRELTSNWKQGKKAVRLNIKSLYKLLIICCQKNV